MFQNIWDDIKEKYNQHYSETPAAGKDEDKKHISLVTQTFKIKY